MCRQTGFTKLVCRSKRLRTTALEWPLTTKINLDITNKFGWSRVFCYNRVWLYFERETIGASQKGLLSLLSNYCYTWVLYNQVWSPLLQQYIFMLKLNYKLKRINWMDPISEQIQLIDWNALRMEIKPVLDDCQHAKTFCSDHNKQFGWVSPSVMRINHLM